MKKSLIKIGNRMIQALLTFGYTGYMAMMLLLFPVLRLHSNWLKRLEINND